MLYCFDLKLIYSFKYPVTYPLVSEKESAMSKQYKHSSKMEIVGASLAVLLAYLTAFIFVISIVWVVLGIAQRGGNYSCPVVFSIKHGLWGVVGSMLVGTVCILAGARYVDC